MKAVKLVVFLCAALGLLLGGVALADNVGTDFESFVLGVVDGQQGWTSTGAAGHGCAVYDHAVAAQSLYPSFGNQSLRISDAVTSGCFSDQTFAAPLTDSVGESDSTAGAFNVGSKQRFFVAQFDIASASPNAQQPGLHISVSPDRGDGSRMSYLRFEDGSAGIDVFFDDVEGISNPANFVETKVATGLDRKVPHHIILTLTTLDGPSNDIVKAYIDGNLVITGTSWENYYRYDSESSGEQSPRIVKTLIFRSGGAPNPLNQGKGFLFDNLQLFSGSFAFSGFFAPVDNPGTVNAAKAGQSIPVKWNLLDASGNPVSDPGSFVKLTSTQVSCGSLSTATDQVETYSGGSGLQYLGGGNWQFNWSTPRDYAGTCRTMNLLLLDGSVHSASFSFK